MIKKFKKITWRKGLLIILVVFLLTTSTERFVALKYDVHAYIDAIKTIFEEDNHDLLLKMADLINYRNCGDYIQSTSDDGQIVWEDLNQESNGIIISFTQACQQDECIVVYYTEKKDDSRAFTEEKSYHAILAAGEKRCSIDYASHWIKDLRIDLGNSINSDFYISSIELSKDDFWNQFGNPISCRRMLLLFVFYCFIGLHFIVDVKSLYNYIYKYRYLIAGGVILFTVILNLNGSSISMWQRYLPTTENSVYTEPLFGVARSIRSDEWATQTPFALSQQYTNFQYFNDVIRAAPTDVEVVYGQPLNGILNIFRPYYWGYNFLSTERGLSFYWISKLLLLFFTSFELGMIITSKNKTISALLATCITLSPGVQWWFSILGVPDVLIFGQLAIVALYYMIHAKNAWSKFPYACILAIAGGGYILVIYPPTQVAGGYIFAVLMLWVLISEREKFLNQKEYNILGMIWAAVVIATMLVYVLWHSKETIQIVQNTIYPGKRMMRGGNIANIKSLFRYIGNIFFPFSSENVPGNVCESASMFDLFPMGLIVAIGTLRRKKDNLLLMLIGVDIWLLCWELFQFPEWLAKISLLSNVQPERCILIIGYANLLIIARALSRIDYTHYTRFHGFIIAFASALLCVFGAKKYYTTYLSNKRTAICIIVLMMIFITVLNFNKVTCKKIAVIGCPVLMILIGGTINPIQQSTDVVMKNELVTAINDIVANESEQTRWVVVGEYPITNIPIMAGAPTINSTNVYPQLELWKKIDSVGEFKNIYNRYAHIAVNLTNEETDFELIGPDSFTIHLNENDLHILGVTHLLSNQMLDDDYGQLKLLNTIGDYCIYKVVV